jgi:hypothetical protein
VPPASVGASAPRPPPPLLLCRLLPLAADRFVAPPPLRKPRGAPGAAPPLEPLQNQPFGKRSPPKQGISCWSSVYLPR